MLTSAALKTERGLELLPGKGKMMCPLDISQKLHHEMPRFSKKSKLKQRKRAKARVQVQKKDPLMVGGQRPRPMFVDYKDVELLKKLTSRQGKILSRRKSGCSAISQHAVAIAIKRARFMALLPYVSD